jgi:hypothetical protein
LSTNDIRFFCGRKSVRVWVLSEDVSDTIVIHSAKCEVLKNPSAGKTPGRADAQVPLRHLECKLNPGRNEPGGLTFLFRIWRCHRWELRIRFFLFCYFNDRLVRKPENLHSPSYKRRGEAMHGSVHELDVWRRAFVPRETPKHLIVLSMSRDSSAPGSHSGKVLEISSRQFLSPIDTL